MQKIFGILILILVSLYLLSLLAMTGIIEILVYVLLAAVLIIAVAGLVITVIFLLKKRPAKTKPAQEEKKHKLIIKS